MHTELYAPFVSRIDAQAFDLAPLHNMTERSTVLIVHEPQQRFDRQIPNRQFVFASFLTPSRASRRARHASAFERGVPGDRPVVQDTV
jgi:hypothetical protein